MNIRWAEAEVVCKKISGTKESITIKTHADNINLDDGACIDVTCVNFTA